MEPSPKGREIELLVGDAGTIVSRGNDITTLGDQMMSSADMLKSIAEGASGQRGLAVDKLQDVVGECHVELKLAGERYQPTGPVLVDYGNALSTVQPLIKTAVANCEADWGTYQTKQSDVWAASTAFYFPPTVAEGVEPVDPNEMRREAVADAQWLADSARNAWAQEAQTFDRHYDTWEEAFDSAVRDIGEATDGGIKDSFWDDLDGFVAVALEVLKWVGLALAVLCIIIGGPFLAAIAAVVALATLVLTIYSFSRGNSTVLDLVLAAVSVIPFGRLGSLFGGGKSGAKLFANDMFGGLVTKRGLTLIKGDIGGMARAASGGPRQALLALSHSESGNQFAGNIASRIFTGKDMDFFTQQGLNPVDILGGIWVDGMFKGMFGPVDSLLDVHNTLFPTPELSTPLIGTPKR